MKSHHASPARGSHAAASKKASDHPRLMREQQTVSAMIRLYCQHHHQDPHCSHCRQLRDFAHQRLRRCRYNHGNKPTCANCTIHCYAPAMRKQIQQVMKWSGPRMLLRHPWLTLRHLLDGFRKAPKQPQSRPLPP
ncbi:nitrous oxide-stimulated promoter family protein [Aeromonas allosaccharophila]|uniref:Nitrous oxide-stimulated promoter family protein n=1 Tax=Aeromonas allosaccharophila TaxID=656 RepID=A0AAX3NW14_9GAMM|nr:nitrous oxide-stimulated promoter family protein [Aeromonas allosaccharophila]WED76343.1 nitrous oxide-stimulated promoter family protein [Aeromonas allosaccharophila]